MVKIFLVDSHTLFREGLKLLLTTRDSTEVIGEAVTAQSAYQRVKELTPDLCIVDIVISGDSIFETVSRLKEICPSMKVLILMEKDEGRLLRTLLEAGADGLASKDGAFDELDFAIKSLLSGYRFISPSLSNLVIDAYLTHISEDSDQLEGKFSRLSPQEKRILSLFCHEMPPKVIALELGISRKTVDIHKRNIKRKLGVDSDIGLIKAAMGQEGLCASVLKL